MWDMGPIGPYCGIWGPPFWDMGASVMGYGGRHFGIWGPPLWAGMGAPLWGMGPIGPYCGMGVLLWVWGLRYGIWGLPLCNGGLSMG